MGLRVFTRRNGDGSTYVTTSNKLSYMVVLDSVSLEETERICQEMENICPDMNYLWWERQKVGIIFAVDKPIDCDALKECEQREIHCSYVTVTKEFFEGETPEKTAASRVSVYTDEEKAVRVDTTSNIFSSFMMNEESTKDED